MDKWNPWKVTALGLVLVMATALITGLVVANWSGTSQDAAEQKAATSPASRPAAPNRVATAPSAAPAPRVAQAGDRAVDIELERLTARTTRMRVSVKHGWIFRDRATAGEIIAQTEHSVDRLPAVTQKEK